MHIHILNGLNRVI